MIFGSCHLMFHQFTQRDKPYQIIADMDALAAFSTAFIRNPDIDRLDQFMGCVWRQFCQFCVLSDLLNEQFKMTVLASTSCFAHLSVLGKQGRPVRVLQIGEHVRNRTCANFCTGLLGTHPKPRNHTSCELRVYTLHIIYNLRICSLAFSER